MIDRALADRYLICRARGTLCAFAVERVVETMRPQPLERLANAPPFVLGLSVIRGAPLPVIDLSALLGTSEERPRRFVTVRVGARRVAVAVSEVIGIRTIPRERLETLPSLLGDAADVARSLGVLDSELLLVLHDARLVPEWVWASLETGGPRS